MSLYINKEYYLNEFKGTMIPENDVENFLELAQEKIDSITYNRIVALGFENLTEFQRNKISKAICYQAEYIAENGYNNENKSDISSYNVLDISINLKEKDASQKTNADNLCMSEIAYDFVKKTGLTGGLV